MAKTKWFRSKLFAFSVKCKDRNFIFDLNTRRFSENLIIYNPVERKKVAQIYLNYHPNPEYVSLPTFKDGNYSQTTHVAHFVAMPPLFQSLLVLCSICIEIKGSWALKYFGITFFKCVQFCQVGFQWIW